MKLALLWGLIANTRADLPSNPHLIQLGNRELVTTVEHINSSGWSVTFNHYLQRKVRIEGWFDEAAIPANWRID
jgi:hypothetical protein